MSRILKSVFLCGLLCFVAFSPASGGPGPRKRSHEVGFTPGKHNSRHPKEIDRVLSWNTFLGGPGEDSGESIAVDSDGNVYVTGESKITWGSPIRHFSDAGFGDYKDAFVAKLDPFGDLQWNTFLGGSESHSFGAGLAVDSLGNVYVAGFSYATWGAPIRSYSRSEDGFLAKIKEGYNLTIASGPHGTTDPAPGTYNYFPNSSVQITALPDLYATFTSWTGDTSGTDNPITVVMDRNKIVKANFAFIYPPTASGERVLNRSFSGAEYINVLTWTGSADNASLSVAKYRIYLMDGDAPTLLAEVGAGESRYLHRNAGPGARTYRIAAVTAGGYEGKPATVSIAAKE